MKKKIIGSKALNAWMKEKVSKSEIKRDYWIRVPKKWWRNDLKGLTPLERCVLIDLKLYANEEGKCFPSMLTIAKDLEIARNSVLKGIHGLVRKEWVKIEKIHPRRNSYLLLS